MGIDYDTSKRHSPEIRFERRTRSERKHYYVYLFGAITIFILELPASILWTCQLRDQVTVLRKWACVKWWDHCDLIWCDSFSQSQCCDAVLIYSGHRYGVLAVAFFNNLAQKQLLIPLAVRCSSNIICSGFHHGLMADYILRFFCRHSNPQRYWKDMWRWVWKRIHPKCARSISISSPHADHWRHHGKPTIELYSKQNWDSTRARSSYTG